MQVRRTQGYPVLVRSPRVSYRDVWFARNNSLIILRLLISVTRIRSESPLNSYNLYEKSTTKHNTNSYDRREERRDSPDYYKSSFSPDLKEKGYDVTDSAYSTSRAVGKDSYSSRYESESPRNRTASPITSKHLGNGSRLDVNRSSSPYRATSPYRGSSPIGRTASPLMRWDNQSTSLNAFQLNTYITLIVNFTL